MNLCFKIEKPLKRFIQFSMELSHDICRGLRKTSKEGNHFNGLCNLYKNGKVIKSSNRVQRGGSWNNNTNNCQSWNRNNNNPNNSNNNIGFRLVNTPLAGIEQSDLFNRAHESPDLYILPASGKEKQVSGVSKQ
tara:strand:- start:258 stop:659 length:402 start_codon:yes stop_codon:yes gene_type:complete